VPDEQTSPAAISQNFFTPGGDTSELNRDALETRLHDLESRYRRLIDHLPAIVYIDLAREQMATAYVSPQIEELLGITPEEYCTDPDLWLTVMHPDDREEALDAYRRGAAAGHSFTFEYRLIAKDGRTVWFSDSATVISDEHGRPLYIQGVMLDITDRKAAEDEVSFLAFHDKLTGLANRAMFDEMLGLALARARRNERGAAVISLDLDNFKLINDSFGHESGDALLVELSDRLREATRDTDLVARPGGDEFLVLLSDVDLAPSIPGGADGASVASESVASRVQEALAAPFESHGTELFITATMGVAVFPLDGDDSATLVKNADAAMQRAKRNGPGGFLLHATAEADALTKLSLSTKLRKAVQDQAWMLHYQPLIDLDSAQMVGVEALIRWPDAAGGLVPPNDFIPLAEEMGLIDAIGDWVVEEICRQDEIWRAGGLEVDIAFNLSPRQLWHPDLVDKIMRPLLAAGMDPSMVTVEITESTAMHDPDRTLGVLNDMHDRGLKLAIDDFGTGYSSLSRLRHMPVDVLKIDRSFVRNVDADHDAASMVSAMIALASNLGMTALAEGIETVGEWDFLRDRGCALGQGFYFAKPMAGDLIMALHRRSTLRVIGGEAS
jgi:diguanylate cyclase (GGDEF)-like protein/PAS domain S-box-containing protein